VKSSMLRTALVSLLAIVPAVSFARQAAGGALTRAQVRQELIDLESVGYSPASSSETTYPGDIQAALQRLAQKRANDARVAQENSEQITQSGYGGQAAAASASGGPAAPDAAQAPRSPTRCSHP
jgi:spermidine/putrescine-binding protein